jgi:hypothetical protein
MTGPPLRPRRRLPKRLLVGAAGAIVVAVLALIVFGSSASNVVDPVAVAAERSASAPGYKIHMSMSISSPQLPVTLTGTGDGVVDSRDHAASVSLTMTLPNLPQVTQAHGSNTLRLDEITDGSTIYMRLPGALTRQLAIIGKHWIAINLAKLTGVPGIGSLQNNPMSSDPSQMLQYLRSVSDSVVAEGHASVDGYDTTQYRAQIDLGRAADKLPAQDQATVRQVLAKMQQQLGVSTLPVDIWIDANHLVRRARLSLTARGLSETITMDESDYGPQARPKPPPADQVAALGG